VGPELQKELQHRQGDEDAVGEPVEEEEDKELVVVEGDTVVDPGAVVVHLEHAVPADGAVVSPVRLDLRASITVPDTALHKRKNNLEKTKNIHESMFFVIR
jgi:hypothetical protein